MSLWLDGLNPEQQEAVNHTKGPLLILAGAGSGKTTVLVSRTGRLIAEGHARAQEIKVLTFTNKSAKELKERVRLKLGALSKPLWTGTFHSFGLEFLKEHHALLSLPKRFGIIDQTDSSGIVKELLAHLRYPGKSDFDMDTILKLMSDWREKGTTSSLADDPYHDLAEWMLPHYQNRKSEMGVVDFDDLILRPTEILKKNPEIREDVRKEIQFLMVDEFQDTNIAQMNLISQLLTTEKNIGVVGDDDQSIYGWRGAQIRNILDFPKKFKPCRVVRLEKNYRSTPTILNLANRIISKNEDRHHKILQPSAGHKGELPELFVYDNEELESDGVVDQIQYFQNEGHRLGDIAILYRSNSQGGVIEGALKRAMIEYKMTGGTQIMDRKEARDTLAYLKASLFRDELSLRRTVNLPARGLGEKFFEKVQARLINPDGSKTSFHRALSLEGEASQLGSLNQYWQLLKELPNQLLGSDPHEAWMTFFRTLGYRDHLLKVFKKPESVAKRWEVVDIMGKILLGFLERSGRTREGLEDFVEKLSLRDADDGKTDNLDAVQLMTLHASKGLEFPAVILLGIEEDILPHQRLGHDISEERRLFYVGLTRAKQSLVLTRARQRRRQGRMRECAPSRFLNEVDSTLMSVFEDGFRPVNSDQRQNLMDDLMKKLRAKKAEQVEGEL